MAMIMERIVAPHGLRLSPVRHIQLLREKKKYFRPIRKPSHLMVATDIRLTYGRKIKISRTIRATPNMR